MRLIRHRNEGNNPNCFLYFVTSAAHSYPSAQVATISCVHGVDLW